MKRGRKRRKLERLMRRLRREGCCLDASHPRSMESYALEVSRLSGMVAALKEEISRMRHSHIDRDLAEEEKKREFLRGFREARKEGA